MIEEIIEFKGIGLLHNSLPNGPLALSKAVAIYADNGRGKSTLSCLLRSLRGDDYEELRARQTLREGVQPSGQLLIDGEKHTLSQGSWDKTYEGVHVFDDDFVEKYVCTGTRVQRKQRQNLLELVLGTDEARLPEVIADALDEYCDAVNARLRAFSSDFEITRLERNEAAGIPRADFALRLMGCEVPSLAAEASSPGFSTALSHGDRRLLALAFYLASLDMDPDLYRDTIVFDDPVSGFDMRRKTRMAEAIMAYVQRGTQVIVLSRDADFLRMLRDRGFDSVLQLRRSGVYCVIEACDIDAICAMDYVEPEPEFEPF